jgi:hypothetical protein
VRTTAISFSPRAGPAEEFGLDMVSAASVDSLHPKSFRFNLLSAQKQARIAPWVVPEC